MNHTRSDYEVQPTAPGFPWRRRFALAVALALALAVLAGIVLHVAAQVSAIDEAQDARERARELLIESRSAIVVTERDERVARARAGQAHETLSELELVLGEARQVLDSEMAETDAVLAELERVLADLEAVQSELGSELERLDLRQNQVEAGLACLRGVMAALNAQAVGDTFGVLARLNEGSAACDYLALSILVESEGAGT